MSSLRLLFVASLLVLAAARNAYAFLGDYTPLGQITVVEYVNEVTGHFVLLADPAEIAAVNAGGFGPWRPTGYLISAWSATGQIGDASAADVCRFYSATDVAHFFTPDGGECRSLRENNPRWAFEGIPFRVSRAVDGQCPVFTGLTNQGLIKHIGAKPVYRLYNNRWMFNDSTHRYTPDVAVRDRLVAQGWPDEGVAFCAIGPTLDGFGFEGAPAWQYAPQATYSMFGNGAPPAPGCANDPVSTQSTCISLHGLASMPNTVEPRLPPFHVTLDPAFSSSIMALTGSDVRAWTAQPGDDMVAIATHSFVQAGQSTQGNAQYGVYLSPNDVNGNPIRFIEPVYLFSTNAPVAGSREARVFPWRDGFQHTLELSFNLRVPTIRRTSDSHVFALPLIQFRDTRGGKSFYLGVQTLGTLPPGDAVVRDSETGKIVVSTVFRPDPLYGRSVSGVFMQCADPSDTRCSNAIPGYGLSDIGRDYDFAITREDFTRIIAAARTGEPALSENVADYILESFSFHVLSFLGGEVGLSLQAPKLTLYWGDTRTK